MEKRIRSQYLIILLALAPLVFLGSNFLTFGEASLDEGSKTPECRQSIQAALDTFKKRMGMPFMIVPDDYKQLFSSGDIDKIYYRDGVKITVSFQLHKGDSECRLNFYKRSRSEPGSYESRTGDYGSVSLPSCRCH